MFDRYQAVPGLRIEPVGDAWAAFSPASGETHLLNDESASLVEWLMERGLPADLQMAARAMSEEVALDAETLADRMGHIWLRLLEAGLVRKVAP